jgi:antitoxin MazE
MWMTGTSPVMTILPSFGRYATEIPPDGSETFMTRVTLGLWGKSLAVRLPAEVAEVIGFGVGQKVEIIDRRDEIIIRRRPSSAVGKMFAGKTKEDWRELYAGTDLWGPDVGREVVEE